MYLKPVVDAHCDTITVLSEQKRMLGELSSKGQLDLPKLDQGGVNVQFFAAFIAPEYAGPGAAVYTMDIIDLFYQEITANNRIIDVATNSKEMQSLFKQNKKAAFLAIEGGEALAGSLGALRMYYRLGVRALTLTWNMRNELADGVGVEVDPAGLTSFGVQVVQEMNKLGMLVDISHIAEKGFWDVLELARGPVVASHANCRAICDHPRNLRDEQIKALAASGGIIGVTFVPQFLHGDSPNLEILLQHIDYIKNLVGVDYIGLGSDFDGVSKTPVGLENAAVAVPHIVQGLTARGYSQGEINKIIGGNWYRVIEQVCG